MNDIRNLARKLTKAVLVAAIAALLLAMVAIPAGAITKMPAQPAGVGVLNGPDSTPIPTLINYQGYLTDSSGTPINAILSITFAIYDAGATQLWTETQPSVSVSNGLFNVLLGSVSPINTSHLSGVTYLGVRVGADAEMTPRQRLVSVAYALRAAMANNADTLDGQEAAAFATVGHTHPDVYVNTSGDIMTGTLTLPANGLVAGTNQLVLSGGNVGIGTATPGYKLHVQGTIYAIDSGSGVGVSGTSSGPGTGVYGLNTTNGNYGRLGTNQYGVLGESSSGNGVFGQSSSSIGVVGYSTSSVGVFGQSAGGGTGVQGISNSGNGVSGSNSATGNFGRLGTSNEGVRGESSVGTGVYGKSSSNIGVLGDGYNYGVWGNTTSGVGVRGTGTGSGDGVYGINAFSGNYGRVGTQSSGVEGYSGSGNYGRLGTPSEGVYGKSANTGVYGESANIGVYGYAQSGTGVSGSSSSGTGVYGNSSSGIGVYGQSNNSASYDFYAAGAGTDYGPFTGAHEVKLGDAFPKEVRPGMIVSVTGETQVRTDKGQVNFSSTLPTVQLSNTPSDKKVFGVLISESPLPEGHWYQSGEGERFGIVNALGDGRVWVTNLNGDIQAGDYITTSAIAGYGQKQDDDLLHSYTLGKATEAVDWSKATETIEFNGQTYKAYPIAVVYTSG